MSPDLSFRAHLDDYLIALACGDLHGACRDHYAVDVSVYENGVIAALGKADALRKLQPIVRRYTMLRGTFDGLECDRAAEEVRFLCWFDGVDVDGRVVRETVLYRQRWTQGRIVREWQDRSLGAMESHPGIREVQRRRPLSVVSEAFVSRHACA